MWVCGCGGGGGHCFFKIKLFGAVRPSVSLTASILAGRRPLPLKLYPLHTKSYTKVTLFLVQSICSNGDHGLYLGGGGGLPNRVETNTVYK